MTKRLIKYLFIIVSCVFISNVYGGSQVSDYDKFCSIVTQITNKKGFNKLAPDQQANEVWQAISKSFSPSSKILSELSMLQLVDPEQKYSLFKASAEEALSREWNCPSYKAFNLALIKHK